MLSFEHLKHFHIAARDGEIGSVDDLYFDDATWDVRYLVVDTGSWLPGRKVLLVPSSFERPRSGEKAMPSRLTREQIRNAPDIDTDRPVERQHEIALHMYYGWPLYWGGSSLASARTLGLYPDRVASGERPDEKEPPMWESVKEEEEKGDPHLRGAKEVDGYRIEAEDGEIGHVRDFLIDENMWIVRYLVADTGGWFSGHDVLIAPAWIKEIRWTDERVHVDLKRETIASSPIYDRSAPPTRDYEDRLYAHYAREKYWLPGENVYPVGSGGGVGSSGSGSSSRGVRSERGYRRGGRSPER